MFVRAYSAAAWLTTAASLRIVDAQRTGAVRFENTTVSGARYTIACGTARSSKGASQLTMQPLPWRAPIIPISQGEGPSLEQLLMSFPPQHQRGSMFRDFVVPRGQRKSIVNATAWADTAATHAMVVRSLQDVLEPAVGRVRADACGGHDSRHTLPEVSRVIQLPARHMRSCGRLWAIGARSHKSLTSQVTPLRWQE